MNERHFRLYERIVAIEDSLEALGPIDKLIERIEELEKMVKQTKTVWGLTKHVSILVFLKACYTNLQPQKKFHTISQGEKCCILIEKKSTSGCSKTNKRSLEW